MRTKIIFDANPLVSPKSGVGYFTQAFVLALAAKRPEDVELVGHYFNFLNAKTVKNLQTAKNITYIPTRWFPTKLLNLLRRFGVHVPLELFVPQKPDVVIFPNFVSLPTLNRPLRVIVVYDLCFIDYPEFVAVKNAAYLRRWVPRSLNTADIVITISDFTKKRLTEYYSVPESRIHVVPIPPTRVRMIPDDTIIQKHKLAGGYVLFVGNIEPRKNIIGLLRAYELLSPELRAKYALVLAGGKGWNDEEILTRIDTLRAKGLRIIQTGYVTDGEKASLYEHATICVQPSYYEGFGMPILEAMQHGKPVACSDIPVFREVAGTAACFFDQNDPESIAVTLTDLLENERRRKELGIAGRARVASYKTWEQIADEFYERIAANQVTPG